MLRKHSIVHIMYSNSDGVVKQFKAGRSKNNGCSTADEQPPCD